MTSHSKGIEGVLKSMTKSDGGEINTYVKSKEN